MKAPRFWWEKPGAMAALLAPFAALYGSIAARRLKQEGARAGIPVICVGNPTVGGAGKTPAAMAIARFLIDAGERPYFLTRGYGGRLAGPLVVEAGHTAVQVGDEPLLLARVAPTVVAANRVAGAELAREKGASVIVMDDGFQNPSLAKDFSILVIDGARGIGNGRVLPAGPLRAPLAPQLDRADAILIVGDETGATPVVAAARARKLPLFHASARTRQHSGRGSAPARRYLPSRASAIRRSSLRPSRRLGLTLPSNAVFRIIIASASRRRDGSSKRRSATSLSC